jgi:hypothetical protein
MSTFVRFFPACIALLVAFSFMPSLASANDEDKAACADLEEGDACERSDGSDGTCQPDESDPGVLSCEDDPSGGGGGSSSGSDDSTGCNLSGGTRDAAFLTVALGLGLFSLRRRRIA